MFQVTIFFRSILSRSNASTKSLHNRLCNNAQKCCEKKKLSVKWSRAHFGNILKKTQQMARNGTKSRPTYSSQIWNGLVLKAKTFE